MSIDLGRKFRLWDYNVSHEQLLLRSPRTSSNTKNVDIIFWGVEYLELPTSLQQVELQAGTEDDLARVCKILDKPIPSEGIHCLVTAEGRFVVVAAGFKVLSNDLDIFESSLEYFRPDNAPLNRGQVLHHS